MEKGFIRKKIADFTIFLYAIPCNALYVILRSLPGSPRDTLYPWGKGINKQKTIIFAFSVK